MIARPDFLTSGDPSTSGGIMACGLRNSIMGCWNKLLGLCYGVGMGKLPGYPIAKETLSPKRFLDLTKRDRENIKASNIEPPKLGGRDFGGVTVEYKYPVIRLND